MALPWAASGVPLAGRRRACLRALIPKLRNHWSKGRPETDRRRGLETAGNLDGGEIDGGKFGRREIWTAGNLDGVDFRQI
jgi:hypothetical protein